MQILFSQSSSIVGAGIRVCTFSRWNHVDILFDDGTLIGAVGFRAANNWRGGVQKTTLEHRLTKCKVTAHKLYTVNLCDENAAKSFAFAQIGKPYDWNAVFGFVAFNRDWQQDDKWFCSELVAAAALAGKTNLLNRSMSRIVPGVLELSPFLQSTPI